MTTVVHPVTTGYFKTLGATVMRGRDFTVNDRSGAERTAIINATLAQRLFGNDDPIGGRIELNDAPLTVVGVVADIRHWGLQEDIGNEVYMPYERSGQFFSRYHLLLRTNAPLQTATDVIRSTIWSIRPDLPVESIVRMQDQISESIADSRFYSILFMVFATISLTLAASGVYSSMLYSVGQRYRELGVRLAIGARPRDITTLILARGSAITALGVAAGLAGAFALVHAIEHLVIGVSATDFRTLAAAVTLLASVAMAACWIPARRASRANPNQVLRFE